MLVEERLQIIVTYTFPHFNLVLQPWPSRFLLLRMHTSNGVNKISGMYYNSVSLDSCCMGCYVEMSPPVITVDFCTGQQNPLQDGYQTSSISTLHNLEIPSRWRIACWYYSKHPVVCSCSSSSVSLYIDKTIDNFYFIETFLHIVITFALWLNLLSSTFATKVAPNGVIGRCWMSQVTTSLSNWDIFDNSLGLISSIHAAMACLSPLTTGTERLRFFLLVTLGNLQIWNYSLKLLFFLHPLQRLER